MDKILVGIGVFVICFFVFLGFYPRIAQDYAEKGYFYGQIDAVRGDIRVDADKCKWIKNPWNNEQTFPIFIPTNNDCI